MDEPDIPMLDVGDFEVLDECVGEDENEEDQDRSYEGSDIYDDDENEDDHENPKRRKGSDLQRDREDTNLDENSGDNGDNILDVSIDVAENEFLESVAKDFSENMEDDIEEHLQKSKLNNKRGEPTVQIKKIVVNLEKTDNESEVAVPRKKPGPRSKTMNIQTQQIKKSIQKINFSDKEANDESMTEDEMISSTSFIKKEKDEQNIQVKTPAFLKNDLTDEEIMIHFDEIENTIIASDSSFTLKTEIDEIDEIKDEIKDEEKKSEGEDIEDENWDDNENNVKVPKIKIEEEEFKESEMWYKEKIKAKENSVEERFTKLAKIIQYSYPLYKKWLDRNESLYGTAICKMESSKHSPLDQLHPNRWKFICNKKHSQQSSKEEEKQADNSSDNKNVQSSWQMIPGVPDANLENTEEYPPFVMRVVKVFEEFLQSLEQLSNDENIKEEAEKSDDGVEKENTSEEKEENDVSDKSETDNEKLIESQNSFIKNLDGLTILLRCNRREELMMHITGKNISAELMDKIKDLFENGAGKDCNVKSLYCKTIIKENNVIKTNNTFLLGSETLDDTIGSVKVQLAPKTNVWANLAGVEVLANVVADYLVPTKKTTVLEIGCGTGLISLLLASKCQKIIGLDIQKEIVEAEITCELNGIQNATFVTGKPKIVMSQIDKALTNSKAVAVINTNNTFGRSIEVISALRKMSTLSRIVVITTLTKQAIRSILELTQPADDVYGNPFIPIKACIVDTTPKGYGFEIVMLMERRTMRNLLKILPVENISSNTVGLISKSKQAAAMKFNSGMVTIPPYKKGLPLKFIKGFKAKTTFIPGKKFFPNPNFNPMGKFQGKRPFPGSDSGAYHPGPKKFKPYDKPWLGPNIRPNPIHDKKLRDVDHGDLREKLSGSRVEPTVIAQEVQEQKKLLDAAKEKLTGVGSSVDVETVKKLQEMLNLAIEKTNKLQSQLPPRSVWDRIAPPESGLDEDQFKPNPMRGRLVKETGPKDIIITTSNNREFEGPSNASVKSKKYDNLQSLEQNLMMPLNNKPERMKMTQSIHQKPNNAPCQKAGPNRFQGGNYRKQDNQEPWSRNKQQLYGGNDSQDRWSRSSPPRRSPPSRMMMRSPPRQSSPPRRPVSPTRRPLSPQRKSSPPSFRQHFNSSRNSSGGGRQNSPLRRHNSPLRRPSSPHNYRGSSPRQSMMSSRQKSPPSRRYADEWDIPSRGAITESGWSRHSNQDKEKTWQGGQGSSNWNQSSGSKYRTDNDKWDNNSGGSSWNNKNQMLSQNSSNNRWKNSNNSSGGTNWDVQKKETAMRDTGRHEPRQESRHDSRHDTRHEGRHESRHEPRWEPPEKSFRNDKDDWGDLPEDARDPWGDDHPAPSQKDIRWNSQSSQSSQPTAWSRDKMNDNWINKQNFPMNNMGGGNGGNGGGGNSGMNSSNIQNPNLNMKMNMNMGMNNPNKPIWQNAPQQGNRNSNWINQGNWQSGGGGSGGSGGGGGNSGGGGNGGGLGGILLGNTLNNWQSPQQNFSNFPSRQFNSFMNNRR